jgi:FtsP/CotA-like multicopper oxidase with cupredoxin domain
MSTFITRSRVVLTSALAALAASTIGAVADELADLRVKTARRGQLNVDLRVVDNAAVPFRLPDGSTVAVPLTTINGTYVPEVWQLAKTNLLRVRLRNQLSAAPGSCADDPDSANIHTHGLIVPASGNGDNMAVRICPVRNGGTALDPIKNGTHHYRMRLSSRHPDGLNWFHPHVHGAGLRHVGAGMSGLISVGPPAIPDVRVRFLALRDLQIVDAKPQFSQTIDGTFCQAAAANQGLCKGATANSNWLFPVNGQVFPTVTIAPNTSQLLRIANTSANVTYRLALGNGDRLCVVAADGVFINTLQRSAMRAATGCPGLQRSELILMPAARAEVLVSAPAADTVLKTLGFITGPKDAAGKALAGDTFPAIDLVKLSSGVATVAPPPASGDGNIGSGPQLSSPSETCTADHAGPGQRRYITLALLEKPATPNAPAVKQFKIGASIGSVTDLMRPEPLQYLAHSGHTMPPAKPAICAKWNAGKEIWRIENHSNELHNFHIHQVKFRVLKICNPDNTGACIQANGENLLCGSQSASAASAMRAPLKTGPMAASAMGNLSAGQHDTVPVPCGAVDVAGKLLDKGLPNSGWSTEQKEAQHPGYVEIEVNFDRPEHIGRYLMHCHILEHQDGGMMAEVVVRK